MKGLARAPFGKNMVDIKQNLNIAGDISAAKALTVAGKSTLSETDFTVGVTTRLKGINYINLGANNTDTGVTTAGITVDGSKFTLYSSVLYRTGLGFQGYDDFDDSYNAFSRNAYVAGQAGINFYTNELHRMRIRENGDIKMFTNLQIKSTLAINDGTDGGSNRGLELWDKGTNSHSIYVSTSGSSKSKSNGTAVAGHDFNSHAIRFRENNSSTNGFIFENSGEILVASINSGTGTSYFKGNMGIGQTSPINRLDVSGGAVVGSGKAGNYTAPTNGIAVEGDVEVDGQLNLIGGAITFNERSSDPANPADGSTVMWMSDGTGAGDEGDIMMKITAGATTKTITLIDFSAS